MLINAVGAAAVGRKKAKKTGRVEQTSSCARRAEKWQKHWCRRQRVGHKREKSVTEGDLTPRGSENAKSDSGRLEATIVALLVSLQRDNETNSLLVITTYAPRRPSALPDRSVSGPGVGQTSLETSLPLPNVSPTKMRCTMCNNNLKPYQ